MAGQGRGGDASAPPTPSTTWRFPNETLPVSQHSFGLPASGGGRAAAGVRRRGRGRRTRHGGQLVGRDSGGRSPVAISTTRSSTPRSPPGSVRSRWPATASRSRSSGSPPAAATCSWSPSPTPAGAGPPGPVPGHPPGDAPGSRARAGDDRQVRRLQGPGLHQRQHPRQRVPRHRRRHEADREVRLRATSPKCMDVLENEILLINVVPEPRRARAGHAGQRQRHRHQPRLHHPVAARDAGHGRGVHRVESDDRARPARLRQPDADRAVHAAAQPELRVRPVHQVGARPGRGHGGRAVRPDRLQRADPLPGRSAGVGRLAPDLRADVRHVPRRLRPHHGDAVPRRARRGRPLCGGVGRARLRGRRTA